MRDANMPFPSCGTSGPQQEGWDWEWAHKSRDSENMSYTVLDNFHILIYLPAYSCNRIARKQTRTYTTTASTGLEGNMQKFVALLFSCIVYSYVRHEFEQVVVSDRMVMLLTGNMQIYSENVIYCALKRLHTRNEERDRKKQHSKFIRILVRKRCIWALKRLSSVVKILTKNVILVPKSAHNRSLSEPETEMHIYFN